MRSPFDADNRPPIEPPARLDPEVAPYWSVVADQWHPDDEVCDRILVGMLARADQATLAAPIRQRLQAEAERVLTSHLADADGHCSACVAAWAGDLDIPYPCWAVKLARLVAPELGGGDADEAMTGVPSV